MNERDTAHVLDRLAKRLGEEEVPLGVKRELVVHHSDLLWHAVSGDEEEFEDLYRQTASLMRIWRDRGGHKSPPGRTRNEERVPAQLGAYEIERSAIFSEYLARLSANTPAVRRFRGQTLSSRLLTPQQARALLMSPFAAHHPRQSFEVYQLPLVGHSFKVTERGQDEQGPYKLIEVSGPSGGKRTLKDRRPIETGPWVVGDNKHRVREFDDVAREVKGYKILPFPAEDGYTHRALVRSESVLGRLWHTAHRLLRNYPWFEQDAVWFLLTGETPYVAPMTVRHKHREHETSGPYPPVGFGYQLVALTVEPWVPAETVHKVYRDLQRRLLGGDNRPVGNKNRSLFSFVTERVGSVSLKPTAKRALGKQLVAEWDQECYRDDGRREWLYHGDTRTFWRDYNLTRKLITSPESRVIGNGQ
jgi:hypothetical protein